MAGEVENLLQPHPLSLSELASLGDGGVAQAVRADFQPGLLAQAADNPVEARCGPPRLTLLLLKSPCWNVKGQLMTSVIENEVIAI